MLDGIGELTFTGVTNERFLTLEEAARIARTTVPSVRHWVRTGKLPAHRPGRRVLVERETLIAFLRGELSTATA